jgi:predicted nucleotidyltransferase
MTSTHSPAHITIPRKKLKEICRRYQVQRLAWFGPVLRKDFRIKSDVEMVVAFLPNARIGFLTLARMRRELTELYHRQVDLIPVDGLKLAVRDSVLSDIEEVYAA